MRVHAGAFAGACAPAHSPARRAPTHNPPAPLAHPQGGERSRASPAPPLQPATPLLYAAGDAVGAPAYRTGTPFRVPLRSHSGVACFRSKRLRPLFRSGLHPQLHRGRTAFFGWRQETPPEENITFAGRAVPLSRLRAAPSAFGREGACPRPEKRSSGGAYSALPCGSYPCWRLAWRCFCNYLVGYPPPSHFRAQRGFFMACPSPLLGGRVRGGCLLFGAFCPLRGSDAPSGGCRAGGCPAPFRSPYSAPLRFACVRSAPRHARETRSRGSGFPLALLGFAPFPSGRAVALASLAQVF